MSNVFSKELGGSTSTNTNVIDEEINEEQIEDKENREKVFCLFCIKFLLLIY
jgi:hypothetical protein